MDCLSPISIFTPAKYISPCFSDTVVQYVRCGKCANCQETLSREWYYRAFYEYRDCVSKGGYMLMDCLSYAPKYVPRVSRYMRLPKSLNFMCFDYSDLRHFFVRLRTYLKKRGFEIEQSLRYFAACEYGTREDRTHRPHIHILFYCTTPGLDNITLSKAVSSCWHYGRTDGVPFKSRKYVNEYTISAGLASSQRACKYVSKYVMKSSEFQKVVDKRLARIMHYIYEQRFITYSIGRERWRFDGLLQTEIIGNFDYDSFDSFCRSEGGKSLYRNLRRKLDQFHRQSLGFGASAIDSFDMDSVMETNLITIPDSKKVVMRIGLPMYYKRKLFYELVNVDGVKYWIPNEKGKEYLKRRKLDSMKRLSEQYSLSSLNYGYKIDSPELLSDYVINKRGRIDGVFPGESTIIDRINSPLCFYGYTTSSDKKHFHHRFLSRNYLGNSKKYEDKPIDIIEKENFIRKYVYFNRDYEEILSKLDDFRLKERESTQALFNNHQRLVNVYKSLQLV